MKIQMKYTRMDTRGPGTHGKPDTQKFEKAPRRGQEG